MFTRFWLVIALLTVCLPAMSAPQPYVLEVRSGGVPVSGLASQLNSAEAAYNATTGAAVTTGLPTVAEYGTSGRYYLTYDAAANGPLTLTFDAGTTITDPNERYITLAAFADPALIASAAASSAANGTAIVALPTAASFWAYSTRTLTTAPPSAPTPGQNAAGLMQYALGHGMTFGQLLVLLQAGQSAGVTNSWSAGTHTLSTAYQFAGDSLPILTTNTVFPSTQTNQPAPNTRSAALGVVFQP